ncbi:unnamed protein product, partial [Polarella glacialis]
VKPVFGGSSLDPEGGATGEQSREDSTDAPGPSQRRPQRRKVLPGFAVVAVNNVTGDVGLMQQQLLKPQVTLWVRVELLHPSQIYAEMYGPEAEQVHELDGHATPGVPGEVTFGNATIGQPARIGPPAPRCACIAMEDEEAQILTRWTICGVMFG